MNKNFPRAKSEKDIPASYQRAQAVVRGRVPNLSLLGFALKAIDYLMENDGFVECSKAEFAWKMGWIVGEGREEKPNRRLVEDVCNLTRDQELFPEYQEALGGYVIAYAPSQGGMSLVDPTSGEIPLHLLTHLLLGDLQKQQAMKTVNRRRLSMWRAAGDSATFGGDQELSRLFHQAENEISLQGFVSDSVTGSLFKVAATRGLMSK